MRQRKLKDLDERLLQYSHVIIDNPKEYKGNWHNNFEKKGKLFLEIGCGKGGFVSKLAERYPADNFLALEGQASIVVKAAEKMEKLQLKNVLLIKEYILDIKELFDDEELDGIYLNFSDPWPKKRHAKRRLTYRGFLKDYGDIIKKGGFIEFKTDNDDLYKFTLEEIQALGLNLTIATDNLHESEYSAREVMTEYEEKFSSMGKNINYLKIDI